MELGLPAHISMKEIRKIGSVFTGLFLYNYFVVDKISLHYGLTGGMRSFSDLSTISVLSAIVIAPLIEESVFRGVLVKNDGIKFYMYIFLSVLVCLFIDVFSGIILSCAFLGLFLLFLKRKGEFDWIFVAFVIFGAITFCLVHVPVIGAPTYQINLFVSLLAFLPVGLFLSFSRVKYGLRYSILLHGLYNLIILCLNAIVY